MFFQPLCCSCNFNGNALKMQLSNIVEISFNYAKTKTEPQPVFFSFAFSCLFFPLAACKCCSPAADLSSSLTSLQAAPDLGLNVFHLYLIGSPHQEYSLSSPFLYRTGERSWPNVFSCRSVYLWYTDSSHLHLQEASQAADQKIKYFLLINQTGAQRLVGPLNTKPPLHLHWRSSLVFFVVFLCL